MRNNVFPALLILLMMFIFTSCKDDDTTTYIVNNTYLIEMSFDGDTKPFGFKTNGQWSVSSDADWITFDKTSGGHTGKDFENLKVTATANDGFVKRVAKLIIESNGETNYINLVQFGRINKPKLSVFDLSHGLVVVGWDLTDGWRDLETRSFTINLIDTESNKVLRSYKSNITSKKYCYNRFVFAKLDPQKNYTCNLILHSNNPLVGDSFEGSVSFTTEAKPIVGSNVLIYKDFDNFWIGGNAIWGALGVDVSDNFFKNYTIADEFTTEVEPTTNTVKNALDGFSANATVEYKIDRWGENYADWRQGGSTRVYETAGFVKFGTSSNNGILATPLFTRLTTPSSLKVSFKACPYSEPNANGNMTIEPTVEEGLSFKISIVGAGKFENGKTSMTLKNNSNTNDNPDTDHLQWTQHSLLINGADATTRVKIETLNSADNYRMWLDDLIIEKI